MEPGMVGLVARTGWIFTSGLYLGWGTEAQKDSMAQPSHSCLASGIGSQQVSPPHQAGPRVGILKGWELSDIFANLSKTSHSLPVMLCFAYNLRVCESHTTPFFLGTLSPWPS